MGVKRGNSHAHRLHSVDSCFLRNNWTTDITGPFVEPPQTNVNPGSVVVNGPTFSVLVQPFFREVTVMPLTCLSRHAY